MNCLLIAAVQRVKGGQTLESKQWVHVTGDLSDHIHIRLFFLLIRKSQSPAATRRLGGLKLMQQLLYNVMTKSVDRYVLYM